MTTLSVWTPHDGLLACVAPLGLAAAAGTALVVDLDPAGPDYPGELSLATLVADGPRRADLSPQRPGLAVLRNGGVDGVTDGEVAEVVGALAAGWPHLVLRLPSTTLPPTGPGVVPVLPALPGPLALDWTEPAVQQTTGLAEPRRFPGVTLPRPRRSTLLGLLRGTVHTRSRWIRAWYPVWEMPW